MRLNTATRGPEEDDADHYRADHGLVWEVLVAENDPVEFEQVVIVLESMKLEIPVESEHAGTVRRIAVAEGDAVNQGDVLVERLRATARGLTATARAPSRTAGLSATPRTRGNPGPSCGRDGRR